MERIYNTTTKAGQVLQILLVVLICSLGRSIAQELPDFLYPAKHNVGWLKYSDAQNLFYHHLTQQVFDLLDEREREISQITSVEGWQRRQAYLKEILPVIAGSFPEKTPLNSKVLRTIQKDGYRIEHLVYESRPKLFVTASIYIPDGLKKSKAPAVIYCSGHSEIGYRGTSAQHIIVNLVKKGFIVLAFDPLGQGERIEYFDPQTGETQIQGITGKPWVTHQHSYPGAQAFITGSSQASYMMWDGIRAIDYLFTRREVNTERIGITGGSGGGTQSAMIAALDDRIYATAPERYITNFKRLIETIGYSDAEQNLYNQLLKGIDHADYLLVRAPKPALMITTSNDFFSIQGARETAAEVAKAYSLFGKPDNFKMVEDYAGHNSTQKNREAMYGFFQKHLENPGSHLDEKVELPGNDELKVTDTGNVQTSLGSETVFSLNKLQAVKQNDRLNSMRENSKEHLKQAVQSARQLSGFRKPEENVNPVFSGKIEREGYTIERYFITGEGSYPVPYLLFLPDKPNHKALLYLHPKGKSAEASPGGEMEMLVKQGFTVLSPDLIGLGEMGPGIFKGDAFIDGVSLNMWIGTMLIGRSIVGIRAGDVLRLAKVLKNHLNTKEVFAIAKSELTPVLLHAAAFEPSISRIALIEPLSSYFSIVTTRFYKTSLIHGAVPGSLQAYDLPDLAAALAPRKLLMANITDASAKIADSDSVSKDLEFISTAYRQENSSGALIIRKGDKTNQFLMEWAQP